MINYLYYLGLGLVALYFMTTYAHFERWYAHAEKYSLDSFINLPNWLKWLFSPPPKNFAYAFWMWIGVLVSTGLIGLSFYKILCVAYNYNYSYVLCLHGLVYILFSVLSYNYFNKPNKSISDAYVKRYISIVGSMVFSQILFWYSNKLYSAFVWLFIPILSVCMILIGFYIYYRKLHS